MKKWMLFVGVAVTGVAVFWGAKNVFTSKVLADDIVVSDDMEESVEEEVPETDNIVADEDMPYLELMEEENYIVDLVSKRTGQSLNNSDWKVCLDYLKNNYDGLINDETVDADKVMSYTSAYEYVAEEENMPLEQVNDNPFYTRAKYDPVKAKEYVKKWYNSFNPTYPSFDGRGGDCANFVSQALHAGGMPMVGNNASNFHHWFCKTKSHNELKKISSTWRGADAFGHYWMKNAKGYRVFNETYFASRKNFEFVYKYTSVGDAISILNYNGRPFHTVIVTYKNRKSKKYPNGSKMIEFGAHTSPKLAESLYDYMAGSGSIRVYDMY